MYPLSSCDERFAQAFGDLVYRVAELDDVLEVVSGGRTKLCIIWGTDAEHRVTDKPFNRAAES